MSIDATNWAWSQQDVSSSEKLVLLAYADRAGETHEAWPSWRRLVLDTCLDRKTVGKVLEALQQKGKMIKTGEKKKQVLVYRLLGVQGREAVSTPKKLSTTSPKNGTGSKKGTSPKNGTGTSPKNGTGTSPKNGTRNHQLNPQRNPKGELLVFSSFSSLKDFENHIKTHIEALNVGHTENYVEEVMFYADKFKGKRDQVESLVMALPLIRDGRWKTPHGFKGITSKSIREKEEAYEREKQVQIQKDAQIGRALSEGVKSGKPANFLAQMIKDIQCQQ